MTNGNMNAVRFHGKHDLRYEEIPIPDVKAGQVKIRPAWVGICGTGGLVISITREAN
jgi:threonine dehydrogenase-like Zn-dependent dehydrogenase